MENFEELIPHKTKFKGPPQEYADLDPERLDKIRAKISMLKKAGEPHLKSLSISELKPEDLEAFEEIESGGWKSTKDEKSGLYHCEEFEKYRAGIKEYVEKKHPENSRKISSDPRENFSAMLLNRLIAREGMEIKNRKFYKTTKNEILH